MWRCCKFFLMDVRLKNKKVKFRDFGVIIRCVKITEILFCGNKSKGRISGASGRY